jgi:hypothetical protein
MRFSNEFEWIFLHEIQELEHELRLVSFAVSLQLANQSEKVITSVHVKRWKALRLQCGLSVCLRGIRLLLVGRGFVVLWSLAARRELKYFFVI